MKSPRKHKNATLLQHWFEGLPQAGHAYYKISLFSSWDPQHSPRIEARDSSATDRGSEAQKADTLQESWSVKNYTKARTLMTSFWVHRSTPYICLFRVAEESDESEKAASPLDITANVQMADGSLHVHWGDISTLQNHSLTHALLALSAMEP